MTEITKDWCLNMARAEEAGGDPEIGAGSLIGTVEAELREALRAQVDASTRLMRAAKFTERDILDCTAQAHRALALPEPQYETPSVFRAKAMPLKSTQAMRDRCRELSRPDQIVHDDYDRAVACIIDDLEALLRPCGECHLQPGEVCDICGRSHGDVGGLRE